MNNLQPYWNAKPGPLLGGLLRACFLLWVLAGTAQAKPQIASEVDTTSIRIGEQIRFTVRVTADTTAQVIFPEGQTFSPLETVEAFKTDTARTDGRMELIKTYALTQFDSGAYLLPSQRIEVDGIGYFTDSLFVGVATVPVDTLTQKMYDIKPLIEVSGSGLAWLKWLGWGLLALLVLGAALYWFVLRPKPLSEEAQKALLPPFERAMSELKQLEQSPYLIRDEFKEYYTALTDIVRRYLEDEVHVSALESTTDQLMTRMELLMDSGELNLEPGTLREFRSVLETADLVKFARSRPEVKAAEADRLRIERVMVNTHDAIPEPTEEELMEQEAYREAQRQQRRKKRMWIAAGSLAGLLLIGAVGTIGYYGFQTVRDKVLGTPTKSLLEGDWIASSYGYPPILLETPEVLYRKEAELPAEAAGSIRDMDVFAYDNPKANFSVFASSTLFADPKTEPDFEQAVERVLERLEQSGARNLITKQESFTTVSGVEGIKVYGSGRFQVPDSNETIEGAYAIVVFGGNGFMQQLVLSWKDNDPYSEAIVDRILQSLDVKTSV